MQSGGFARAGGCRDRLGRWARVAFLFLLFVAAATAAAVVPVAGDAMSESERLAVENAVLRNEALMLLNDLNHWEVSQHKQVLVAHDGPEREYRWGEGRFQTLVRASSGSGSAANMVLECAAAERVLYRFLCPADVTAPTTITGVMDC